MGNNYAGQLNSADLGVNQLTPVQIASSIQRFFAGLNYLIYEKTDGTLWSVGRNVFGQLGDERQDIALNAPTVLFDQNVSSVAAGRNAHSFVIKSDGSLWGMGNNVSGRLGDGTGTHRYGAVKIIDSNVSKVAAGGNHSLFLEDNGSLWAMGANDRGQLGDGTQTNRLSPVQVVDENVSAISIGNTFSHFTKTDGSLWGMGKNEFVQLGDGSNTDGLSPVQVLDENVSQISTGLEHTMFIKTDGSLWGMGRNQMADWE